MSLDTTPLVPPPPRRVGRPGKPRMGYGWLVWPGALVIGLGLGIAGYRFVPGLGPAFDYWLLLALAL